MLHPGFTGQHQASWEGIVSKVHITHATGTEIASACMMKQDVSGTSWVRRANLKTIVSTTSPSVLKSMQNACSRNPHHTYLCLESMKQQNVRTTTGRWGNGSISEEKMSRILAHDLGSRALQNHVPFIINQR
jgi:hypothetical protein